MNLEVILNKLKNDGLFLRTLDRDSQNNRIIVMEAVKQNGLALQYASDTLKNDRELVLVAILENSDALQYASDELKNDKELVLEIIKENGYALKYVSDNLKQDKDVVISAIRNIAASLKYAHDELKNDKDIALLAVKRDGTTLEYINEDLKKDRDVVLASIKQSYLAINYADSNLIRNDKQIILEIIKNNPLHICKINDNLKQDKDIVFAAITKDITLLRFVSPIIKSDKNFVLNKILPLYYKDRNFIYSLTFLLLPNYQFSDDVKTNITINKELLYATKKEEDKYSSLEELIKRHFTIGIFTDEYLNTLPLEIKSKLKIGTNTTTINYQMQSNFYSGNLQKYENDKRKLLSFINDADFIPHLTVFNTYPEDKIMLFNKNKWFKIAKYPLFNISPETRAALTEMTIIFGIFENENVDSRFTKLINLVEHIPMYLSMRDYSKIESNKDIINRNYHLEERIIYYHKNINVDGDQIIPIEYSDELDDIISKELFLKIKNGDDHAKRHYMLDNYIEAKEKIYVLNDMIDENDIKVMNGLLRTINHDEVMTDYKIYRMFNDLKLEYSDEFYQFIIDNYFDIIKNDRLQVMLPRIQFSLSKIKEKYGRDVDIFDCKRYFDEVTYENINQGNEKLAFLCKMCGLSQAKFEKYQSIYNVAKQRTKSSVPAIEVRDKSGLYGKILSLNDPLNLLVGEPKFSNCCQKLGGEAEHCMIHASTSTNGRIFLVYNEKNQLLMQSWVWLNNGVLCFDNIEVNGLFKNNKGKYEKDVINIYKKAAHQMVLEYKNILKHLITTSSHEYNTEQINDIIKYQAIRKVTVGNCYKDILLSNYFDEDKGLLMQPEETVNYSDSNKKQYVIFDIELPINNLSTYKNVPLFEDNKSMMVNDEMVEEDVADYAMV